MGKELVVRPETLREADTGLRKAADALHDAWQEFQADARNLKFGETDLVGSLIGTSYMVALDWAQKSYDSAIKTFREFGEGVHAMAEKYEAAEQASESTVQQTGKGL